MIKPRVLASCHHCQMYRLSGSIVCRIYPVGFPGEACPDFAPNALNEDDLSWNRVHQTSQTDSSEDQESNN